jgi:succinate dehydrogenase/fumarate reductase flavoprotein subunit
MVGNEGKSRIIYNNYSRAGFDPEKDMLQAVVGPPDGYVYRPWGAPSAPQWREMNGGGLVFDWDLKTSLDGLYVAGSQKAGNGNHSNAATTGRYAGRKAAEYARKADRSPVYDEQVEMEKQRVYAPVRRDGGIGWKELKAGLCRIMQDYCGEYKHENTLKRGLEWFESIKESEAASVYARNPHELVRALECLNHITLGELVMEASLARKAGSSALFFKRLDYPEMDPPEWNKFITLKLENNMPKTGELPFRFWLQEPYASSYEENYQKHCSL